MIFYITLEFRSIEFMRRKKSTPLFMTFLDVIEVPEHDKAIKNLVSMCLCVSVCVCVFHHDYSTFLLYYRGRNGTEIFVILL
jgi:hypothetical protein